MRINQKTALNFLEELQAEDKIIEQQHVTRFNKYNGTIKTPYSYKGCVSGLDAYIKSIHDSIEVARRNKSDAASGALDKNGANVFSVTCNCPDKDAGN